MIISFIVTSQYYWVMIFIPYDRRKVLASYICSEFEYLRHLRRHLHVNMFESPTASHFSFFFFFVIKEIWCERYNSRDILNDLMQKLKEMDMTSRLDYLEDNV